MASHPDSKEGAPHKVQELVDISKAIDLLCLLNVNDLRTALRTLEGGSLGVFLGDNNNKQAVNVEKVAAALPRHLLAHIVTGDRNYILTHPGTVGYGWLAYTAKGLHLVNCFISLEFHYPRLAAVQRGLEQRSCILDLLLLAGAVWNTELAGAASFSHYVLCAEGIRLTSAALGTALQHDLDRGVEIKPFNKSNDHSSAPSSSSPHPSTNGSATNGVPSKNNNNSAPLPYSYEWYDALIIHPKLNALISLPVDTINLLQQVTSRALQTSPDHVPKLCRSFHTLLEAFYLMCCSEEFVGQLLLHPIFVEGQLLDILQQTLNLWKSPYSNSNNKQALTASGGINAAHAFLQTDPIASVVNQILRVLYILFEKENPCFLDAVAASPKAFQHMQTIISIATHMSSRILGTSSSSSSTSSDPSSSSSSSSPETFRFSALESFRLIEILSDDSNFKNEVISRVTPLLLQLLSFAPATLEALFTAPPSPPSSSSSSSFSLSPSPQQLQRDFMIVVFRVVGNLHCFNEHLCKPEDKGLFLRTFAAEMSSSSSSSSSSSLPSSIPVNPSHVLANLKFLLFKLISERQVFHLNTEELDLVTSFSESLQQTLPPSSSSSSSPPLPSSSLPSSPAPSSSLSSSSSSLPPSISSPSGDVSSPLATHKRKHTDTLEVQ